MSLGQVREFRFSSWSALVVEAILAVLTYGFAIQEGWSHPVPWILMLVAIGLLPFFVLCHLNRRLVILRRACQITTISDASAQRQPLRI
jgi:hypothetical protein